MRPLHKQQYLEMVDLNSASWNRVAQWLVHLQAVQQVESVLA